MGDVSRAGQIRWIDMLAWLTTIWGRALPADSPAGRMLARLEPYRTDRLPPVKGVARGYRIQSVSFRLRARLSDTGAVVIQGLAAELPCHGEGTAAMRKICGIADACGAVLILDARPYATAAVADPMLRADLAAWYGRFGFLPTGKSGMRRDPLAREPAA
jgi:hypothetical protein